MNNEKIGAAAGAVWGRLRDRGPDGLTINDLKRKTDGFTADEIVAGIGWLARENKVRIDSQGRKTVLKLVERELVEA